MQITPDNVPSEFFTISDNTDAARFIEALGYIETLENKGGLPEKWPAVIVKTHVSHWFILVRFEGYELPEDNGYLVQGFPKDNWSFERVRLELQEFMDRK